MIQSYYGLCNRFHHRLFFYLKRIANYQSPDKKEWDWITFQEDDLP